MIHTKFETQTLEPAGWDAWFDSVEKMLGHSLNGVEQVDGFSVDGAYDAYLADVSPEWYVESVMSGPLYAH